MMSKLEFIRVWGREAVNQPGLPIETLELRKDPILLRPVMRKSV